MSNSSPAAYFQSLPTASLLHLASNPSSISFDQIGYLQAELLERDEQPAVLDLNQYVAQFSKTYDQMTQAEIADSVKARLEAGESFLSIKADLQHYGIDAFERLAEEAGALNNAIALVTEKKLEHFDDDEIKQTLQLELGLSDDEIERVNHERRVKGNYCLVFGYIISVAGLIGLAMGVSVGPGVNFAMRMLMLLVSGVVLVAKGYAYKK